jgi:hypothetical protein
MAKTLQEWTDKDVCSCLENDTGTAKANSWYTPMFMLRQKNKDRAIADFTELNYNIEDRHYHMDTAKTVRLTLATNLFECATKFDITDAYHHLPHRDIDKPYLRIRANKKAYELKAAIFGLKCIPWTWFKVSRVPVGVIRANGISLLLYVDDGKVPSSTTNIGLMQTAFTIQLFQYLGYRFKHQKMVLMPQTKLEFIGLDWDYGRKIISVPAKKLKKLRTSLASLLKLSRHTVRTIAKVSGYLVSLREGLQTAMAHARPLQRVLRDSLRKKAGWDRAVTLTTECHKLIKDFLPHLNAANGISYLTPNVDLILTTDASEIGFGCNSKITNTSSGVTTVKTGGKWTNEILYEFLHKDFSHDQIQTWLMDTQNPLTSYIHIQILEAIATFIALRHFNTGRSLQKKTILLLTDNIANAYYIAKQGGTGTDTLSRIAEAMIRYSVTHKIRLFVEHIPGAMNDADLESRRDWDVWDWMLNTKIFHKINQIWGPHNIDAFATGANTQLDRYWSWVPEQEADATDAMRQVWSGVNLWINPPWAVLHELPTKILRDKAMVTVVIPWWPTQPWFPLFLELLSDIPIILDMDPLYEPNNYRRLPPLSTQLIAVRLSGHVTRHTDLSRNLRKFWQQEESQKPETSKMDNTNVLWIGAKGRELIPAVSTSTL